MRRLLVAHVVGLMALTAQPADAQWLWFNGVGLSIGGGPMHLSDVSDTPLSALIRPAADTVGAVDAGSLLYRGFGRWALIVPEVRALSEWGEGDLASGSLTLGSNAITFEPRIRSFGALALLAGAQVAIDPAKRVWVRGEIGSASISSHIETDDRHVVIDLSSDASLAVSGAAGVSVWRRPVGSEGLMSIDAEVHYMRINSESLRLSWPSVRVGWKIQMKGR